MAVNSQHFQKTREHITFDNLNVLSHICGANNINLSELERLFDMPIFVGDNGLEFICNSDKKARDFTNICEHLQTCVHRSIDITTQYISLAYYQLLGNTKYSDEHIHLEMHQKNQTKKNKTQIKPGELLQNSHSDAHEIYIPMAKKRIVARSKGQTQVVQALKECDLSFLIGPAGTGKTFLTTAYAISLLLQKKVKKYIITRPVVEAGEKLGFLPGDLVQKVLPYLRPVYDALEEICGESIMSYFQERNQIEIAPLAYMRGRTLHNCVVLLDEAQNCTVAQMKMFLTRIGEDSTVIVNGDLSQSDLGRQENGLQNAMEVFANVDRVKIVRLNEVDVQRSELAKLVVSAYARNEKKEK